MMSKWLLYGGAFVVGTQVPGDASGYLGVLFLLFFVGSEHYQQRLRVRWQEMDKQGDPIIAITRADLWIMEITRVFGLVLLGCAPRYAGALMLST
jgi:hypothetical protein